MTLGGSIRTAGILGFCPALGLWDLRDTHNSGLTQCGGVTSREASGELPELPGLGLLTYNTGTVKYLRHRWDLDGLMHLRHWNTLAHSRHSRKVSSYYYYSAVVADRTKCPVPALPLISCGPWGGCVISLSLGSSSIERGQWYILSCVAVGRIE